MRALVFQNKLPRQAAAKLGGYISPSAFTARTSPVRLEEVLDPVPPDHDWVVCDTIVSGMCGSDTKQIFLHGSRDNPLTALISFPHILGHEAVARRRDDNRLVLVNPWLSCAPRGIDPVCSACKEGNYPACRNFTTGCLSESIHLGNCADAGGTHADSFVAHESQLFRIPDHVTPDAAVLGDPVSVSLHSILKSEPNPDRPALVYGCGTLGLAAIALLKHLYPDTTVWAISRPGPNAELAAEFGASEVITARSPDEIVNTIAALTGVRPLTPWSKRPWLQDGPGVVYDTVGSPESVETALRFLDTRGSLVVSGVEAPKRFEWTPLYFKEISMIGSNAFGVETVRGVTKHAFEHYFDFVADGFDLTPIVTHHFALSDWADAVATIANRSETGAIKVVLEP